MRVLYSAEEDSRGEIAIAATTDEWCGVLLDLLEMRRQIHFYRNQIFEERGWTYEYEAGTKHLIEQLEVII